jgi:hypothetical protein
MEETMQITQLLPKVLAAITLTIFLSNAQAAEAVLCDVTSDIDNEVAKMVYELDEETGDIKHLFKDRYVNGKRIEREELHIKDLLGDGIVLAKKDKTIAVRMYGHNFDAVSGGVLFLDTLYNGVNGERREYSFEVAKSVTGLVMVYKGVEFKKMHFIAKRSRLLGIIGIEKVNFLK